MAGITEAEYELALIELFQSLEGMQYRYEYRPDIARGYTNPILDDVLQESLHRISSTLPLERLLNKYNDGIKFSVFCPHRFPKYETCLTN